MQKRDKKSGEEPKKEGNIFFRIELSIKEDYDKYCLEQGYSVGKRLRSLIKADLEQKIKI